MSAGTKDRFKELGQVHKVEDSNEIVTVEEEDEVPPQFKEVFHKVYEIRNWISNIRANTKKIKDVIQSNNSFLNKSIYDEVENRVKDTYNIAFKITNELKDLDVKVSKKDDKSEKSVLSRIKRIQYGSLRQDFQNALFESNDYLEKYRDQKRFLLKKQASLVNATLEDEELEKLLDNPDSVHLFTDNILFDTRVAKDQLAQIEERHSELLKIENMITEVNSQFRQIAVLVEQQKEHIDRIEYHACDAINYVDKGLVDIQNAEKSKRKMKKMYIIIFCVIVFIIVLLLLLLK